MTEKELCGCCGYALAPEKLTNYDHLHRPLDIPQQRIGPVCEICANSLFLNSIRYRQGGNNVCVSDMAQALGYIANLLLDEIRKEKS